MQTLMISSYVKGIGLLEEDDLKDEVTIWTAFFANQIPLRHMCMTKGFWTTLPN